MKPDRPHRHQRTRRTFLSASVLGLASAHAPAWTNADELWSRHGRRRVTPLCSLPPENYQHEARTPSLIVRSLPAIEQLSTQAVNHSIEILREYSQSLEQLDTVLASVNSPSTRDILAANQAKLDRRLMMQQLMRDAQRPQSKLMQLATRELTIAHCQLSDVALLIEPSGIWHLSLRGDQNFLREDQNRVRNVDLQIKRNAFHVRIRLLRSIRSGGENLTPEVANETRQAQAGKLAFVKIHVPEFWVQREAPQFITRMGQHPLIQDHYDDIDQAEFEFFVKLDPLTGSGEGVVTPWQREP